MAHVFICKNCETEFNVKEEHCINRNAFKCPFCGRTVVIRNKTGTHSLVNYLALYKEGKSIEDIAKELGVKQMTVRNNLLKLYMRGNIDSINFMPTVSLENERVIRRVIQDIGVERLRPIKESCPDTISYDDIAVVVAKYKVENNLVEEKNEQEKEDNHNAVK